jgi:hypothetical protein
MASRPDAKTALQWNTGYDIERVRDVFQDGRTPDVDLELRDAVDRALYELRLHWRTRPAPTLRQLADACHTTPQTISRHIRAHGTRMREELFRFSPSMKGCPCTPSTARHGVARRVQKTPARTGRTARRGLGDGTSTVGHRSRQTSADALRALTRQGSQDER